MKVVVVVCMNLTNLLKFFVCDDVCVVLSSLMLFIKLSWPVIKSEILVVLNALPLTNGQGFASLNDALISLLQKKDEAVEVKDFRPISLIHSFGKLFSKIMESCLSSHLDKLVAVNQSAFIKDHSLHDNFRYV